MSVYFIENGEMPISLSFLLIHSMQYVNKNSNDTINTFNSKINHL